MGHDFLFCSSSFFFFFVCISQRLFQCCSKLHPPALALAKKMSLSWWFRCSYFWMSRSDMHCFPNTISALQPSIWKNKNKASFQVQKVSQRLPTTLSDLMSGDSIFWSVEVAVGWKIDPFHRGSFTPRFLIINSKRRLQKDDVLFDFTGCCKIDTHHKLLLVQIYLNSFNGSWQILHIL